MRWDVTPYCTDPLRKAIADKRARKLEEEQRALGLEPLVKPAAAPAGAEAETKQAVPMDVVEGAEVVLIN